MNLFAAFLLCCLVAIHAMTKKSLSSSGILGAFIVGLATFRNDHHLFAACLLIFFVLGSRIKADRKRELESHHVEGGERDIAQVFSNSLTGAIISILHHYTVASDACMFVDRYHTVLVVAYISHYACCNGDTFASEIGILSKSPPILITTFKSVPHGTNGGISVLGTVASVVGGAMIAVSASPSIMAETCANHHLSSMLLALVVIGASAGFFGSIIDSILGATLQISTYDTQSKKIIFDDSGVHGRHIQQISGSHYLTNNQVNFVSSLMSAISMSIIVSTFL